MSMEYIKEEAKEGALRTLGVDDLGGRTAPPRAVKELILVEEEAGPARPAELDGVADVNVDGSEKAEGKAEAAADDDGIDEPNIDELETTVDDDGIDEPNTDGKKGLSEGPVLASCAAGSNENDDVATAGPRRGEGPYCSDSSSERRTVPINLGSGALKSVAVVLHWPGWSFSHETRGFFPFCVALTDSTISWRDNFSEVRLKGLRKESMCLRKARSPSVGILNAPHYLQMIQSFPFSSTTNKSQKEIEPETAESGCQIKDRRNDPNFAFSREQQPAARQSDGQKSNRF
ncbi:hypothetical protein DFH07DRAFT_779390 [Mycena maculata]|uniref:Uncharacterized protein n=1 Tax=Mycena maculata TaxID=230809 RepID=A0AAD7I8K9_9AGAR|nr:hypothetical protein DFH07DRAFT_779390 [Mycena maculata]